MKAKGGKNYQMRQGGVYTTGDISRMLKAAPRTVSKWIDAGELEGYRLPMSSSRRVTRESLLRFLAANKMPLPQELVDLHMLAITYGHPFVKSLSRRLEGELVVREVNSAWSAGVEFEKNTPAVVLFDLTVGRSACLDIASRLTCRSDRPLMFAMTDDDTEALPNHFDATWHHSHDTLEAATQILEFIKEAVK